MTSITDQVKILEAEHADALARIASLEASNQALVSENTALKGENTALVMQADQLIRHSNDTRAMAEKLGNDALELLRQSRREAYKPPEVVRFAPKINADEVGELLEAQRIINAKRDRSTPEFQAALGETPVRPVREINEAQADAEQLVVPAFLRRDQVFASGAVS